MPESCAIKLSSSARSKLLPLDPFVTRLQFTDLGCTALRSSRKKVPSDKLLSCIFILKILSGITTKILGTKTNQHVWTSYGNTGMHVLLKYVVTSMISKEIAYT